VVDSTSCWKFECGMGLVNLLKVGLKQPSCHTAAEHDSNGIKRKGESCGFVSDYQRGKRRAVHSNKHSPVEIIYRKSRCRCGTFPSITVYIDLVDIDTAYAC
jgi:hypothetical protein